MSRHTAALRLALESDAAEEQVSAAAPETTDVDVSGAGDGNIESETIVVAEATGDTEEETIAVDGSSDAAAGSEGANGEAVDGSTAAAAAEAATVDVGGGDAAAATETETTDGGAVIEGSEGADAGNAGDAGAAEEAPAVIDNADDVVVDGSDSAEEAVADANAAGAEADVIEEQKDELEEAATGLESIYNELVLAQQKGGLTRQGARMATLAIESYTVRTGDDEPVMASLENFGGDDTRLRATNLSMEVLGEKIKHYWSIFYKFIMKLKSQIWAFIQRLFSASERLAQRGQRLAKLQLSGAANKPHIELKGYAKKVAVGNRLVVDPMMGLKECLELVNETTTVSTQNAGVSQSLYEYIYQVAAGTETATGDNFAVAFTLPKAFKQVGDHLETKTLPGNVKFVAETVSLNDGKIKLFKRIAKVNVDAQISEEAKIAVMTPEQVKNAGLAAIKVHEAVKQAQAVAAKAVQMSKSLKAPQVSATISDEDAKKASGLLNSFRSAEIQQAGLISKVCATAVNASLVYLKIAEMSAVAYGATDKTVEKAAA